MSGLRLLYLALAAWGAVHPMSLFIQHMRATGTGIDGLLDAFAANAATRGLTWDLLIASIAFWAWVTAETLARRNWAALVAIPATVLVGLSFALPLYLFVRTAPLR